MPHDNQRLCIVRSNRVESKIREQSMPSPNARFNRSGQSTDGIACMRLEMRNILRVAGLKNEKQESKMKKNKQKSKLCEYK